MKHNAAFLSQRQDWETPQAFFDRLNERYKFTLDAAASQDNAKCDRYFTEEDDALTQPWEGVVFCNPPYSHGIGKWVRKGFEEACNGSTVVMLIPARTDTAWFHDYVMKARSVTFIRGRMRFGGSPINAPFPSMVVVFDKWDRDADEVWFKTMDRILDEQLST